MSASRRRFLRRTSMAVAGLALGRPPRVAAAPSLDLVVRGGTVLDGTGAPAFRADVGLVGDRIAALGEIAPEQARRVIDASGLHGSRRRGSRRTTPSSSATGLCARTPWGTWTGP